MHELEEVLRSGAEYAIWLRSGEEFAEFKEIWDALQGESLEAEFLRKYAAKADLCLHLRRRGSGNYRWTWSDKDYCFVDHPEIEVHTIEELRTLSNDLGEIDPGEANVFELFLEVVNDMELLWSDSCD